MKNVVILGCTGSIGDSTLSVLSRLSDQYRVIGMSGANQKDKLRACLKAWKPDYACVRDEGQVDCLTDFFTGNILFGSDGLCELASLPEVDVVINALVGAVGLKPTLAALEAGKVVAIANKEPLVMAGKLIMDITRYGGGEILPLDSEPNAIWQCLHGQETSNLSRIILTASGGSFRDKTLAQMENVTPAEALNHPTWKMGSKITIDSATLMNKGFEVIEASFLFDVSVDNIDVVIHRQSVIHSMIEMVDGSVLAHMGKTDMQLPIQYALTYPNRLPAPFGSLDLNTISELTFSAPNHENFPSLKLCYEAARSGGGAPTVLNAANEVGVSAFLSEHIGFLDIYALNEHMLCVHGHENVNKIEDIMELDCLIREEASEWVSSRK